MTRANPPPRECLLHRLVRLNGRDWTKDTLNQSPGLLLYIVRHAETCERCASDIQLLFPEGIPDSRVHEETCSPELLAILDELRRSSLEAQVRPLSDDFPGGGISGNRPGGGG